MKKVAFNSLKTRCHSSASDFRFFYRSDSKTWTEELDVVVENCTVLCVLHDLCSDWLAVVQVQQIWLQIDEIRTVQCVLHDLCPDWLTGVQETIQYSVYSMACVLIGWLVFKKPYSTVCTP